MEYINEEDIDSNNVTLSRNVIHLDKYDMYYINFGMKDGTRKQVRVFCEKNTIPDFDSSLFKRYQKSYGTELSIFFVKRLLGPNGLMAKSGRDDYIYLGGEFLKDGHVANRGMIQENGKTGQENFEANFFKIKMQVEAKEEQKNKKYKEEGKHYAIADIHGMYGSYMEVINRLSPQDHLYIIGDVIDRGNGGIRILQDIMQRIKSPDNNPEITFLLGNHEMQFIETVGIMLNHELHKNDLVNIINRRNVKAHIENLVSDHKPQGEIQKYKESLEVYEKYYEELLKSKELAEFEVRYIETWMTSNKGVNTIFDYLACSPEEKEEIYTFLYNSYVALPQRIGNSDYLFVHAMPPKDEDIIREMKKTGEGCKFYELSRRQYEFMLQTRECDESTYEDSKRYGYITICGHEADLGNIEKNKRKGYIRIDAGCGHKQRKSKLALYCIEDDKVQYIDEKEEMQDIEK